MRQLRGRCTVATLAACISTAVVAQTQQPIFAPQAFGKPAPVAQEDVPRVVVGDTRVPDRLVLTPYQGEQQAQDGVVIFDRAVPQNEIIQSESPMPLFQADNADQAQTDNAGQSQAEYTITDMPYVDDANGVAPVAAIEEDLRPQQDTPLPVAPVSSTAAEPPAPQADSNPSAPSAQDESSPLVADESEFDEVAPVIEDNLPPGATVASIPDKTKTFELSDEAKLMADGTRTISATTQPFNSMRIKLIQALQHNPVSVVINGQTIALKNPKRVAKFYREEQYPTIWTLENHFNDYLPVLQKLITDSEEDALNPQRYHAQQLIGLAPNIDYNDIVAYELLASDAYLTLLGDLANGLVDPHVTQQAWNAPPVDDALLGKLLAKGVVNQDLATPVAQLNADNQRYQALKKMYNRLRMSAPKTAASKQNLSKTLRLGMNTPEVLILRDKLNVPGGKLYDDTLKQSVMNYQRSLGLQADGIVGAGTRRLLNQSLHGRLDKVMINMERQRWLPQSLGNPYILVNIPSFRVIMYQNNQPIYESKSVVGRPERPTPTFIDRLQHIVMSPTWTVPPTIMQKDKLPRLKRNPGAFDGNFEVITPGGSVVRPSAVNWSGGGRGYTLRQKPGARNALGRIKFLFPNKHAIYLHDTPSKNLFNRTNRAYSSGCVRLQKPLEFADILLNGTKWTPESIRRATQQSRERWVNPPHETPIYLVYWTLWSTPGGEIREANDIYNLDKPLLKQYNDALTNP